MYAETHILCFPILLYMAVKKSKPLAGFKLIREISVDNAVTMNGKIYIHVNIGTKCSKWIDYNNASDAKDMVKSVI